MRIRLIKFFSHFLLVYYFRKSNLYIFIKNQYIQNEKIQFKYYFVLVFFEFLNKIIEDKISKIPETVILFNCDGHGAYSAGKNCAVKAPEFISKNFIKNLEKEHHKDKKK